MQTLWFDGKPYVAHGGASGCCNDGAAWVPAGVRSSGAPSTGGDDGFEFIGWLELSGEGCTRTLLKLISATWGD